MALPYGKGLRTDRTPVAEPDHAIGVDPCRGEVLVVKRPRQGLVLVRSRDREHDEPGAGDPGKGQCEALVPIETRGVRVALDQPIRGRLECG